MALRVSRQARCKFARTPTWFLA